MKPLKLSLQLKDKLKLCISEKFFIGLTVIFCATILALHNPFGGYEHEKVLYSKSEFLKHIREAFPEYWNIKDDDLYSKIIEKHPNFKTWILEETDGSEVKPVGIPYRSTNYRLIPPPAYYGKKAILRSKNAFFPWLDEPIEFVGFESFVVVVACVLFFLFRIKI